ncbi:hypothetical protein Sj15T_23910 [Sphingobium sp. TA15]|nr:hypothetical protein Sj15T_23910 [Sphingobium sp. TA15]
MGRREIGRELDDDPLAALDRHDQQRVGRDRPPSACGGLRHYGGGGGGRIGGKRRGRQEKRGRESEGADWHGAIKHGMERKVKHPLA